MQSKEKRKKTYKKHTQKYKTHTKNIQSSTTGHHLALQGYFVIVVYSVVQQYFI